MKTYKLTDNEYICAYISTQICKCIYACTRTHKHIYSHMFVCVLITCQIKTTHSYPRQRERGAGVAFLLLRKSRRFFSQRRYVGSPALGDGLGGGLGGGAEEVWTGRRRAM